MSTGARADDAPDVAPAYGARVAGIRLPSAVGGVFPLPKSADKFGGTVTMYFTDAFDDRGTEYRLRKTLGSGEYGTVALYSTDEPGLPPRYAVKTFKLGWAHIRDEIIAVNLRNTPGDPAGEAIREVMVPAVYSPASRLVVMQPMRELSRALEDPAVVSDANVFHVAVDVAIKVFAMQRRLIAAGMVYTDVKPANLAVGHVGPGGPGVAFIDYGSLCSVADGPAPLIPRCMATYPTPPAFESVFDAPTPEAAAAAAKYWCGLLAISIPMQRAANWHGDATARRILTEMYDTLAHNSAASSDAKGKLLSRLQFMIRKMAPDERGETVASWLAWNPSDRK